MYDYRLMEAFASVVENEGFEKAASKLYITQSAVSQRIKQLEEQIGQILLIRGNPPTPTEAGQAIIAHFKKVRLMESDLTEKLHMDETKHLTTIPIALNADTLTTWFLDSVSTTVQKHNILLDLRVDDQEETHRMLKSGEVTACVSTRSKAMQSCKADLIGTMHYHMFASPEFKAKYFPDGLDEKNIKNTPVIIYNHKDTLHLQMFNKFFGYEPEEYPKTFMPSVEQYLEAALRGFGLAMMPLMQCREYLTSGELINACEPYVVEAPLYFHRWNVKSKHLDLITKSILKANLF